MGTCIVYAFGGVTLLPEPLVTGYCISKIAVAITGTPVYGCRTEPGQAFLQNQFYSFAPVSIILSSAKLKNSLLS